MRVKISNFVDVYALSAVAYVFVAGASALVEWSTFFALTNSLGVFQSAIIAFFVATVANYVLSRSVAFKSKRTVWKEIGLLFALSAIAFLFNLGSFALTYMFFDVHPVMAKMLGTCVGFSMNYAFRQFVIFKETSRFGAISDLLRRNRHSRFPRTGSVLEVIRPHKDR